MKKIWTFLKNLLKKRKVEEEELLNEIIKKIKENL